MTYRPRIRKVIDARLESWGERPLIRREKHHYRYSEPDETGRRHVIRTKITPEKRADRIEVRWKLIVTLDCGHEQAGRAMGEVFTKAVCDKCTKVRSLDA